jgi:DNA invertase Pin-like site-specific DNA recombinase
VELLRRCSNWTNWTDLLKRLRQSRQAGRPEASPGRGTARRLSEEQVAKLVDGYTDGLTMKELANYFKIHRTTVSLHLK